MTTFEQTGGTLAVQMQPQAQQTRSLARKLAEVMAAVERIPKTGRNEFHHYDYATEADIVAAVRQELASRHIIILPSIVGRTREPVGEKGNVLTHLDMVFTFIDGESGEERPCPWLGAGTDKEDKGCYKAMTGGEKYFLLKTFLIPTGDDPEADAPQETRTAGKRNSASVQPKPPASASPQAEQVDASLKQAGKISLAQRKRLFAISSKNGWKEAEVKDLLQRKYGLASSADIPWTQYDEICSLIEAGIDSQAANA